MQAQTPEVSTEKATTATFKVGDPVSYVVAKQTSRSIKLSTREGTIVVIEGNTCIVESRHGRSMQRLSKISHKGEPNALTKALLGVANA